MSGIGDYIHYHRSRYNKYGIGKESRNEIIFSHALYKNHETLKNIYDREKDKANWAKYQTFLQEGLYGAENGTSKIDKVDFQKLFMEYLNTINQDVSLGINELLEYVTESKVSAHSSLAIKNKDINKKVKNKSGEYQLTVQKRSIAKAVASLQRIMNMQFSQLQQYGFTDVQTFEKLQAEASVCYRIINNFYHSLQGSKDTSLIEVRTDGSEKTSYTRLGALFNVASNLIKNYNKLYVSTKLYGDTGEAIFAALTTTGARVAQNETYKLIDNVLVGKDPVETNLNGFSMYVDTDKLFEEMNSGKFQPWTKQTNGDIISSSQGTVDMSIALEEGSKLAEDLKITQIRASIKNYRNIGWKGVSIVSGTPLLSLFMLMETDFINHYLNIISSYKVQDMNQAQKQAADNEIKYATAIRGLFGARSKNNIDMSKTTNCFIVNDRSSKRVLVKSVQHLLNDIEKDISLVKTDDLPDAVKSEWVGNRDDRDEKQAIERITKLLADIHKIKISASISLKN